MHISGQKACMMITMIYAVHYSIKQISPFITGFLIISQPGVNTCDGYFTLSTSFLSHMLSILSWLLAIVLLSCLFLFFIQLQLELLTQSPASNDEKYFLSAKIDFCKTELLYKLIIFPKNVSSISMAFSLV